MTLEIEKLGPFDGVVAAVVKIQNEDHLITTNTNYVPALPGMNHHDVFMRRDMRYGLDDPTVWPQQFSEHYCHLAVMRSKEGQETRSKPIANIGTVRRKPGSREEDAMMWWDPTLADFIPQDGPTLTAAFGKLDVQHWTQFSHLVKHLLEEYNSYVGSTSREKVPSPLPPVAASMRIALERLTLPCSYDGMVHIVRVLQRTSLEVDAMIRYMSIFKPLMENPLATAPDRAVEYLVGAFTGNASVVSQLHTAGVPFWYVRAASLFAGENILAIVTPREPSCVEVQAHERLTSVVSKVGPKTVEKIEAISKLTHLYDWYRDPFERSLQERDDFKADVATAGTSKADVATAGTSRTGGGKKSRYTPYPRPSTSKTGKVCQTKQTAGRNKFVRISNRREMPPGIESWELGLRRVDQSRAPCEGPSKSDQNYVLPEPALLVAPDQTIQRQTRLHHYILMCDALHYRIANERKESILLNPQEWRDVLGGRVVEQGPENSKVKQRTGVLQRLLAPALQACGLEHLSGIPADPRTISHIGNQRAQEIIWEVAETNFRYELLALDRRASGTNRPDACRECLVGGMMVAVPIEYSRQGFAAAALSDRHIFNVRLARLMSDWKTSLPIEVRRAETQRSWSTEEMQALEEAVATLYCQAFYDYFGRAAVIPMRTVSSDDISMMY
ncbi:hypothetical protein B0H14DRAFT_3447468 [Mycena olivaceomarginata]|nr:hypothetical protein B0H14DRAFT_3447468 [Mycena olivaceomarginata]